MLKTKSEIRKSYFLNTYVIITPSRALRPRDVKEETVVARAKMCVFCPENIDKNNIIYKIKKRGQKTWQVLCLGNVFPAVTLNNPKAYGKQEVIIDTPNHNIELGQLHVNDIELVLKMYAIRTEAISKIDKINYILCFKNQGSKAGASIAHAHSQVFATHIVPPQVHEELGFAHSYLLEHGVCAYCDVIKTEIKSPRVIFNDKYVAAFAPYASQYHYEAWIIPKRHIDNIALLNKSEYKSLAKALKIILFKLHKIGLSYNFYLDQVVSDTDQHIYIKVQPRDSVWAGVELGSGLVINSIPPEDAAKYYRSR